MKTTVKNSEPANEVFIIKSIESTGEVCIKFTAEEMVQLGIAEGDKFSIDYHEDGSIRLEKYVTMDLNIADWSREVLEMLVSSSCKEDISINEVINNILIETLEHKELLSKRMSRVKHH